MGWKSSHCASLFSSHHSVRGQYNIRIEGTNQLEFLMLSYTVIVKVHAWLGCNMFHTFYTKNSCSSSPPIIRRKEHSKIEILRCFLSPLWPFHLQTDFIARKLFDCLEDESMREPERDTWNYCLPVAAEAEQSHKKFQSKNLEFVIPVEQFASWSCSGNFTFLN